MTLPQSAHATDKAALRAEARRRRAAFTGSRIVAPPAAYLALLEPGMTVAAYYPLADEADPAALVREARARDCRIVLPHVVTRATPLRFLVWEDEDALAAGPFGLSQPHADAADHAPDIVLTPLVAFDATLNRLGQGAGYYDRAFAALPDAIRIGIALSMQQVDALPCDAWDVPLHAVITEQGWLTR